MDYPKTMVRNHIHFHGLIAGTDFERFWSLDSHGEYLQLNSANLVANYGTSSSGEKAFVRFLLSVWDRDHERDDIQHFTLADVAYLDGRYAHTFAQWAADPFWA